MNVARAYKVTCGHHGAFMLERRINMENRKSENNLGGIFLLLSFFFVLGLIGNAELGGSMYNLLWAIPIGIADAIIIYREES